LKLQTLPSFKIDNATHFARPKWIHFCFVDGMNSIELEIKNIESKIFIIRGKKVMLDEDLAKLYEVPTMRLNEQVKRNIRRFPSDFMFVLTEQELSNLISQFAISSSTHGGRRNLPTAFTEQGIAMLSSVLRSDRAIDVNIAIMRAFIRMREILISNQELESRITELEQKYDGKFSIVFDALRKLITPEAKPLKKIKGLSD
jgi:hypothetical protein